MKKYIAVLTATSTTNEVLTLNANDHDEALELAAGIADELTEEGVFDEDDMVDVDVYELHDVPEISTDDECHSQSGRACAKALSRIVRIIRDTDGELPDEVMAKLLLNAMFSLDVE